MRIVLIIAAFVVWTGDAVAQKRERRRSRVEQIERPPLPQIVRETDQKEPARVLSNGTDDALDEVNARRARRGLKPFIKDDLLTKAAAIVAKKRAAMLCHGHLPDPDSDLNYVDPRAKPAVGGCGALEDSWGWGTCCMDDTQYTYGGAAWARGRDGLRYMQLFVR